MPWGSAQLSFSCLRQMLSLCCKMSSLHPKPVSISSPSTSSTNSVTQQSFTLDAANSPTRKGQYLPTTLLVPPTSTLYQALLSPPPPRSIPQLPQLPCQVSKPSQIWKCGTGA